MAKGQDQNVGFEIYWYLFRLIDLLIDCIVFYTASATFLRRLQKKNGDHLWNFEVSLAALRSLLFIEFQINGLLRAKGVVNLNTGHHLTSRGHLTDIKILYKYIPLDDQYSKITICKIVKFYILFFQKL